MAWGSDAVVITFGIKGALLCRRDGPPLHQPAFRVDVVDTLGAGGAFAAGLAVSWVEGRGWEEALRRKPEQRRFAIEERDAAACPQDWVSCGAGHLGLRRPVAEPRLPFRFSRID